MEKQKKRPHITNFLIFTTFSYKNDITFNKTKAKKFLIIV